MSFTIEQPQSNNINPGLPLVFTDNQHFLNDSLDNLVTFFWKNGCYLLSQEFDANVLQEKWIFSLSLL